jgi:predicted dienelactone hydrolase
MLQLDPLTPARALAWASFVLAALFSPAALGAMGVTELAANDQHGVVTIFYPTAAAEQPMPLKIGLLSVAQDAAPMPGNGRLVLLSHGSGGSPWVHTDLVRLLVEAGFVVAAPRHEADNHLDGSDPGVGAWTRRPLEMSRALDAVAADARFAPLLQFDRVGAYGMSAGGHTVLSLAGGRWSPAGMRRHCEQHLAEDFNFCVGLNLRLTGGWLDGLKKRLALLVIRHRFTDDTPRQHTDPRIVAFVAAVPVAADFDPASFATLRQPLALVTARQDRWLVPRLHSDPVLQACSGCEHLADLPTGGHGALLSPWPVRLEGLIGEMLNDPEGFDRGAVVPPLKRKIADWFVRQLAP